MMAGIYIHIPFCIRKCHYCDFYKESGTAGKKAFLTALIEEIGLQKNYLGNFTVDTIYFGGGTPSVLKRMELESILQILFQTFKVDSVAEITFEANPDDLSQPYLDDLAATSVNRLSIGIQSFNAEVLRLLYRRHSAGQAIEAIQMARNSGFRNLSIDLMYGIPSMSRSEWQKSVETALSLEPEHISAYHLGIEPGTQFGRLKKQGVLKEIDEEESLGQYSYLTESMKQAGYQHYEISNFCREGYESRHNTSYWKNIPYLGLGPSAHSFNGKQRQWNVSSISRYNQSLNNRVIPFETEDLNKKDTFNEYLMTNLRTKWGVDIDYLRESYPDWMFSRFVNQIKEESLRIHLIIEGGNIRIKPESWFVSDHLISELFIL